MSDEAVVLPCILFYFVALLLAFWWLLLFFQREYFSCDSRISGFLGYMEYGLLCGGTMKSGETFSGQCF